MNKMTGIPTAIEARQRALDCIANPSAKKQAIMTWWENGELAPSDAEHLIRVNKLKEA